MQRRDFLKAGLFLGTATLHLRTPRLYAAPFEGYKGKLLVTLQCDGGWDVTSFCDPKTNQPGEKEITHWSKNKETQNIGNLIYAPYANNQSFFEKHYKDMLVINGVDMQTNSHTTGVLHNWSGRNSEGFPTPTAMFAANNAPEQPLSYINFGGFAQTANLIRFSRFQNVGDLTDLLEPEHQCCPNDNGEERPPLKRSQEIERIRTLRKQKTRRMLEQIDLLGRDKNNLQAFNDALTSKESLKEFKSYLPKSEELEGNISVSTDTMSNLRDQIKLTTSAFQSGLTSAADLYIGGFDTHSTHDSLHEPLLAFATDAIQLFWQIAEDKGIADRVTLVIGSDFGRTPHYNGTDGKDHWPIGSVVIMEKNAPWTNKIIGNTDEGHNAQRINPDTLKIDEKNGTIIYPKHVHKALRRHLGIENSFVEKDLEFRDTEDFNFFV